MYLGSLVVGKASTIGIRISPNPPLIFTGVSTSAKLASFKTTLNFEPPAFENATIYPNSETKVLYSDDRHYVLAKFGEVESTRKRAKAVDYSISLKFCTKFKRMTSEVQFVHATLVLFLKTSSNDTDSYPSHMSRLETDRQRSTSIMDDECEP